MQCKIIKNKSYFTIQHNAELLDCTELELGYSQLTDMALYSDTKYKSGICDLSSIHTVTASLDDLQRIIDALVFIFTRRPDFNFITVTTNDVTKNVVTKIHHYLKNELGFKTLHIVKSSEEAQKLALSLN